MKVLITGGAGFIGSNLARAFLKKKNAEVRIIDDLSVGRIENIKDILKKIKFVKADINDRQALSKIIKGVDFVFHKAALNSVTRSLAFPLEVNAANTTGTLNVLLAAKEAKVKRLIYATSSSVYGNSKVFPVQEHFPSQPISNYGVTKMAGEHYCRVFDHLYGLETVRLRYFNVFGPYQNPNSEYAAVIPKFVKAIMSDQPITIYGDGLQSRAFTYVDNIIEANFKALAAPSSVAGNVFNITAGHSTSLLEIVAILEEIFGRKLKINFEPARKCDIKDSSADLSLAKKHLKFKPVVDFREGLKRTVDWYRKNIAIK